MRIALETAPLPVLTIADARARLRRAEADLDAALAVRRDAKGARVIAAAERGVAAAQAEHCEADDVLVRLAADEPTAEQATPAATAAPAPVLTGDEIPQVTHVVIDDREYTGEDEYVPTPLKLTPKKTTFALLALRAVHEAHCYGEAAEGANYGVAVRAMMRDGTERDATAEFLATGWRQWREHGEASGRLEPVGACPVETARERVQEARQNVEGWVASRDRNRECARIAREEADAVRVAARDGSGRATEFDLTAARNRQSAATRSWSKAEDRLGDAEREFRAAEAALAELLVAASPTEPDHAVVRAEAEPTVADDAAVQLAEARDEEPVTAEVPTTETAAPAAGDAWPDLAEEPDFAAVREARAAFRRGSVHVSAASPAEDRIAAFDAAENWSRRASILELDVFLALRDRRPLADGTLLAAADHAAAEREAAEAKGASAAARELLSSAEFDTWLRAVRGDEYMCSDSDEDEDQGAYEDDDEPPTPPTTGGGIPARRSASPPWATGRYGVPPRDGRPAVVEAGPRVVLDDDADLPEWARGPDARPAVHLGRGIHAVDLGALLALPGDQSPPGAAAHDRRPAPPVTYGIEVVLDEQRTAWLRCPGTGSYAGVRARGDAADVLGEDGEPVEGLAGVTRAVAWKAALGRMKASASGTPPTPRGRNPVQGDRYLVQHTATGAVLGHAVLREDGWTAVTPDGWERSALPSQAAVEEWLLDPVLAVDTYNLRESDIAYTVGASPCKDSCGCVLVAV